MLQKIKCIATFPEVKEQGPNLFPSRVFRPKASPTPSRALPAWELPDLTWGSEEYLTGKSFYRMDQFPHVKAVGWFWIISLWLKKPFQRPKYKLPSKSMSLQRCCGYSVSSLVSEAAGHSGVCSSMLNTTWANLWRYIGDEQFLGRHGTAFNFKAWILC